MTGHSELLYVRRNVVTYWFISNWLFFYFHIFGTLWPRAIALRVNVENSWNSQYYNYVTVYVWLQTVSGEVDVLDVNDLNTSFSLSFSLCCHFHSHKQHRFFKALIVSLTLPVLDVSGWCGCALFNSLSNIWE